MRQITPEQVKTWKGRIIDVRNPDEFAASRLPGAELVPLPTLPVAMQSWNRDEPIVVMCKSGGRSKQAYEQMVAAGFTNVSSLAGGIDACKNAGVQVIVLRRTLPIFQQVMIAAGTLILLGLILGRVHWAFYTIDWLVACGMIFAGVTGFCGMAKVLERMPWNRVPASPAAPSCCSASKS
jgi:rhodanese-related sulfurtransferase